MEIKTILLIFATVIALAAPAMAQEDLRIISIQYKPADTLDSRYNKCIAEPDCPLQLRLQLVDELQLRMSQIIRRIEKNCAKLDYNQCIAAQSPDFREWHRLDKHMANMMKVIEGHALNVAGRDEKFRHSLPRER